jgi:hypothetical protein
MVARPTLFAFGLLAAALSSGSCSKPVDLKQALEVTVISSGWFDAGIQNGKNKLVPSITYKLKKNGDVNLTSISLNHTFIFIDSQDHSGDVFVQNVPFEGAETAPIVVRSEWGYTADPPQTRAEMLKNSYFRDMEVAIFGKRGSAQWVELQRMKVARQLLTQ